MYRAPLHLYVLWHPKYKEGQKIAEYIYSTYNRNIDEPLNRGIGIPVFYRSINFEDGQPLAINYKAAERNAIIVLVEDKAIIHWQSYILGICNEVDSEKSLNRIFPIALNENFQNIGTQLSENNFLRVMKDRGLKKKMEKLTTQLTHELCRMLYGKPRFSESSSKEYSEEPISLFISHAKRDGGEIASELRTTAQEKTSVSTFFDAIDIAPGSKWKTELEANIENSALIVVQTDAYSSREWCRWEVLKAKKNNRPVVVINAIKDGEERSFPYLGNVPTIRLNSKSYERTLDFVLMEILRFYYTYLYISERKGLRKLTGVLKHKILASPPELLTLLEKAREEETKGELVIYPDPPLTNEEMELLNEMAPDFEFLTPTLLEAHSLMKK
jgi:hypothetical protein